MVKKLKTVFIYINIALNISTPTPDKGMETFVQFLINPFLKGLKPHDL